MWCDHIHFPMIFHVAFHVFPWYLTWLFRFYNECLFNELLKRNVLLWIVISYHLLFIIIIAFVWIRIFFFFFLIILRLYNFKIWNILMSKRMGLISHQVDNGLLYVFVPGFLLYTLSFSRFNSSIFV